MPIGQHCLSGDFKDHESSLASTANGLCGAEISGKVDVMPIDWLQPLLKDLIEVPVNSTVVQHGGRYSRLERHPDDRGAMSLICTNVRRLGGSWDTIVGHLPVLERIPTLAISGDDVFDFLEAEVGVRQQLDQVAPALLIEGELGSFGLVPQEIAEVLGAFSSRLLRHGRIVRPRLHSASKLPDQEVVAPKAVERLMQDAHGRVRCVHCLVLFTVPGDIQGPQAIVDDPPV